MSEFNWITRIENVLNVYITTNLKAKLDLFYPSLNITTEESSLLQSTFPTVYLHILPMVEIGADLEGKDINAVRVTYEAQVYVNTSKDDVNIIVWEIMELLKAKSFTISTFPEPIGDGMKYECFMRATRVIGNSETWFTDGD